MLIQPSVELISLMQKKCHLQMKTGIIKTIKKNFGFITVGDKDFYFHKSGLLKHDISIGDRVEFDIENSPVKKGLFQATKIKIIEKKKPKVLANSNSLIGNVKWFDSIKRFGFINKDSSEYFFHISSVKTTSDDIKDNDFVVFEICE